MEPNIKELRAAVKAAKTGVAAAKAALAVAGEALVAAQEVRHGAQKDQGRAISAQKADEHDRAYGEYRAAQSRMEEAEAAIDLAFEAVREATAREAALPFLERARALSPRERAALADPRAATYFVVLDMLKAGLMTKYGGLTPDGYSCQLALKTWGEK